MPAVADDQNPLAVFDEPIKQTLTPGFGSEPIEENLSASHQFLQAMSHTRMFQQ